MGKVRVYYNHRGFTLMEILIAVTLIGIIIWILIPNFLHTQARSRDGRRKADIGKISEALEEYRSDYGFYPTAYPTPAVGPRIGPNGEYLKIVPVDPKYKTDYCYIPSANKLSYTLSALFELEQSECPWAPTATPTPIPQPTATPGGPTATPTPPPATPTPPSGLCSPCMAYTPSNGYGSCCTGAGNGLFANNNCAYPAVGSSTYPGLPPINNCSLPACPYSPPNPVWRQISDPAVGVCSAEGGFGQSVGGNCGSSFGCGAVITNCNPPDSSPYCPEGRYAMMGCICL